MEIPLLDMDLNTVETTLPMVQAGIYDLVVKESEVIEPTDAQSPPVWKLTLATTTPLQSVPTNGRPPETIDPGHPLFTQTQLAPTGKATVKMVGQNVAQIIQSVKPPLPGVKLHEIRQWHKQLEGRMVRCDVICQPAGVNPKTGKAYRAGNRIEQFFKS